MNEVGIDHFEERLNDSIIVTQLRENIRAIKLLHGREEELATLALLLQLSLGCDLDESCDTGYLHPLYTLQ